VTGVQTCALPISILGAIYAGFVSWTAFDYSQNGTSLTVDLMLSSIFVIGLAWLLRRHL